MLCDTRVLVWAVCGRGLYQPAQRLRCVTLVSVYSITAPMMLAQCGRVILSLAVVTQLSYAACIDKNPGCAQMMLDGECDLNPVCARPSTSRLKHHHLCDRCI